MDAWPLDIHPAHAGGLFGPPIQIANGDSADHKQVQPGCDDYAMSGGHAHRARCDQISDEAANACSGPSIANR